MQIGQGHLRASGWSLHENSKLGGNWPCETPPPPAVTLRNNNVCFTFERVLLKRTVSNHRLPATPPHPTTPHPTTPHPPQGNSTQ